MATQYQETMSRWLADSASDAGSKVPPVSKASFGSGAGPFGTKVGYKRPSRQRARVPGPEAGQVRKTGGIR